MSTKYEEKTSELKSDMALMREQLALLKKKEKKHSKTAESDIKTQSSTSSGRYTATGRWVNVDT